MSIKGKRQARAWLFERAACLLESDSEDPPDMTPAEVRLVTGEVTHVLEKIRAAKPKAPKHPSKDDLDRQGHPGALVGP